jgi:hypothetical protein
VLASSLFNGIEGIEIGGIEGVAIDGMEGIEIGGASEIQSKMSGSGTTFSRDGKAKVSRYSRVLKKKWE